MHVYSDTSRGLTRHATGGADTPATIILLDPPAIDYYHIDWILFSFKKLPTNGALEIRDETHSIVLSRIEFDKDLAPTVHLLNFDNNGFECPVGARISIVLSGLSSTKTLTLQYK